MDFVSYADEGYRFMEGVELMSVGMEWPASNGPYTATFDQLAAIVEAANNDPLVYDPRIKLGHQSPVNGDDAMPTDPFRPIGDAEPAFGRIVNLRTTNQGAVLVGDFVEVPVWLADAMVSAFPSRSSEPWLEHTTPGGKHYAAILTAVALLGAYWPAIQDLEDLQRLMEDGPDAVAATTEETNVPHPATATSTPEASIDAGTIRNRFNFDWCTNEDRVFEDDRGDLQDPYWWWARSVRVDPLEIIAEGDEDLWRIPVTTDGEDEVTFGTPERVREVYVPVNATAGDTTVRRDALVLDGQRVLATYLHRPEKPAKPAASRPDPTNPTQEVTMPTIDIPALRERTGLPAEQLPDNATEDQINEALNAEPEPTPKGDPAPEGDPAPTGDPAPETQPAASTVPDGFVQVPAATWAEVQAGAQAGARIATESEETRRDQTIQAALDIGKIPPAQREAMVNLHAERPEAFYTLLTASVEEGGLAEGLVPVDPKGRDTEVNASNSEATQAYIDQHFPRTSGRQRGVRHRQEA